VSDKVQFSYRLPVSCLRIKGSRTIVHDAILDQVGDELGSSASATVALDVTADNQVREGAIESSLFSETNTSLEWSDDGRLVTSSVDATGQGGRIVAGVVGASAALFGVLTANPALVLAASAMTPSSLLAAGDCAKPRCAPPHPTPEEVVARVYGEEHPDMAERRVDLGNLVTALLGRLTAALNDCEPADALRQVSAIERELACVRSELSRLDGHFAAWRATTIETRIVGYEFEVTIDQLREAAPSVDAAGRLQWGSGDQQGNGVREAVQHAFETLDIAVTLEDLADPQGPAGKADPQPSQGDSGVVIRWPRHVRLNTYEKDGSAYALRMSTPALVMDAACHHEIVKMSKSLFQSLFGKRKVQVGFSPGGGLHSITLGSGSAFAGLADTLGSLQAGVAASLEHARKIMDQASALRGMGLDQELERVKKQVQLKQAELEKAGLAATSDSFDELARLKRRAEILTQRKALGDLTLANDDGAAEIASLKQQIELLKARHELELAPQAAPAPPPFARGV
jgi:hypothetical protein